ncbi:mitochondrial ribosomal protein subunit L20-domain-containing protein [Stachybotrys elegans]|uniref:Mitochondrial ribosomal protein subunit L20-domain-containing protein n=1 Tax=Stachybotrys elegans TaxID=80388 RepID=A0A8K0WWE5_9HYPO|nr:mitochondrial ribosomal protein subunit L20-domain-containing protein [Stachybotrys elegans]
MEFTSLLRPAVRAVRTTTPSNLPLIAVRGHKTTSRTKRALKIAPHDSFQPDKTAAFPAADSIIYNPPASEASPFHTPFLFLPPNDPRRAALLKARNNPGAPSVAAASNATLPPEMRYLRRNPNYNMTAQNVKEMRRLRNEDPIQWSVSALAKKFECSPVFVKMAAPAPKEHLEWLKSKWERKQARWGPIKSQAYEDRVRRREMTLRGEI